MSLFLFTDKSPPIDTIKNLLNTHGLTDRLRQVRIDQRYPLERTGTGASFQNGLAERLHRTLADMMSTILVGSNLSSQYWSHAIQHACCIKNQLPHMSLPNHITPFEHFTNRRPDLSHLRIFGSHTTVKQPRIRLNKINTTHTTTVIFLGYTAIDCTI